MPPKTKKLSSNSRGSGGDSSDGDHGSSSGGGGRNQAPIEPQFVPAIFTDIMRDLVRVFIPEGKVTRGDFIRQAGQGTLYHARYIGVGYALKVLDWSAGASIWQEVECLLRVRSPFVVCALGITLSDDTVNILMALEAQDLKAFLQHDDATGRHLNTHTLDTLIDKFEMMVMGIDHMHSKGVIHGNAKPSNTYISPNGTIKLADFGLSPVCNGDDDDDVVGGPLRSVTALGRGTLGFQAPEVMQGRLSKMSDVFSLGMILYTMVHRRDPFASMTDADIHLFFDEGRRPIIDPELCPKVLATIIEGCWQEAPCDRMELREVLQRLEESRSIPRSTTLACIID